MEYILCNKQFVWKAETSFNIRLNDHQKDVKKVDAMMACNHFQQESHNFKKHAKVTIIDQLTNSSKRKKNFHPATYQKGKFLDSKIRLAIPERF